MFSYDKHRNIVVLPDTAECTENLKACIQYVKRARVCVLTCHVPHAYMLWSNVAFVVGQQAASGDHMR